MNLETLKKHILMISSSLTRKNAEEILKSKGIKDIKGKSIDNVYNVYGKVLSDNKSREHSTHIKIDLKTSKIIKSTCTCERFKENRKEYSSYVCKHIIASIEVFYRALKKRENKSLENNKEEAKIFEIKTNIKFVKEEINTLNCSLLIGRKNFKQVLDLKGFLESFENLKPFNVNDEIVFNPKIDKIKNIEIINYLRERKRTTRGKNIRLFKNEFREFLSLLHETKFNYEYLDYNSKILKENVPINLAISIKDNKIALMHHKKFPIFLSDDIVFFDKNIYIPRKKQIRAYEDLYEKFIKNREIKYTKNIKNLSMVLNKIKDITNDVFLDKNIVELKRKGIFAKVEFKDDKRARVIIDYYGYLIDLIKDKRNDNFLRDKGYEEVVKITLAKYGFKESKECFIFNGSDSEKFEFLKYGIQELKGFNVECNDFKESLIDSTFINGKIENFKDTYSFKYSIENLDIDELMYLREHRKATMDFLKIDNKFIDLGDKRLLEFLKLIDELNSSSLGDKIIIDKNKLFYLEERLKNRSLDFIESPKLVNDIVNKIVNKEFKRKLVPKSFKGELRDYQKDGFKWLNEITSLGFGCILADDMGLGKTVQIISYILSQKNKKFLIIAKTSLIYNWAEEFKKFAPTLKIAICHGDKRRRRKLLDDIKNYDVILTSYGSVKNDIEKYEELIFDSIIIDEAQTIKNSKSQVRRDIKRLNSKSNIALTGTPIENNLLELWSIFDFIMPGFLLKEKEFEKRYVEEDNLLELKNLIAPFILRRVKEDVLKELPPKIEKNYYIELSKGEKALYREFSKKVKNDKSFGSLTKLRQFCLMPSLVIEDYKEEASKLKELREMVNGFIEEGKKILIFSQFVEVLKSIEKALLKDEVETSYLDGSLDAKERQDRVNNFNEDSEKKVFLISLMAGGVGLNLTSASVVIHFDPWWNPKMEEQASDRAYRYGQKSTVNVIKLIAKGTIEEKIINLQEMKKDLIDSVIDEEKMNGKVLKTLNKDELLDLLL